MGINPTLSLIFILDFIRIFLLFVFFTFLLNFHLGIGQKQMLNFLLNANSILHNLFYFYLTWCNSLFPISIKLILSCRLPLHIIYFSHQIPVWVCNKLLQSLFLSLNFVLYHNFCLLLIHINDLLDLAIERSHFRFYYYPQSLYFMLEFLLQVLFIQWAIASCWRLESVLENGGNSNEHAPNLKITHILSLIALANDSLKLEHIMLHHSNKLL